MWSAILLLQYMTQSLTVIFFLLFRLLKGRSFPGKVLLTRRSDPLGDASLKHSPNVGRSFLDDDDGPSEHVDKPIDVLNCPHFL